VRFSSSHIQSLLSAATLILVLALAVQAGEQKQVHFHGTLQGNETDIVLGESPPKPV